MLDRCHWPPLSEPYATALREAVAYVLDRFSPVAVVAAGSIVRGNLSPTSDLDLYVLRRLPERQRVQRFFRGVPAEIFVNPPEQVERYFLSEAAAGRPITAHMLATGFAVYESPDDAALEGLRRRAAEVIASGPRASEAELTVKRYLAANLLEDGLDVAGSDPEMCASLLGRAVEEAIRYRFWVARRWEPRHKELLSSLDDLDPEMSRLCRGFYRSGDHGERCRLAREAFERGVGETGFFEWESEPQSTEVCGG